MKIFDISAPIWEEMPVYKNREEKKTKFQVTSDFTKGSVHETRINMDVHAGTHVDAPLHMFSEGQTIEHTPIEKLVGQAKVFDLTHVKEGVSKEDLADLDIQQDDFVLFKTSNSFDEEFNFDFIYVQEDAAQYLAEKGIRGVGVDTLGIERAQPGHPTHKTLMSKEIIIIEGLRLAEVEAGEYFMVAAPIKLIGTDGAPARVLLMRDICC